MKKALLFFILSVSIATSYAQSEYDGGRWGAKLHMGWSAIEGLDDGRTDHLPGTDIATSGFSAHSRLAGSFSLMIQYTWRNQVFMQGDIDAVIMGARLKGVYLDDDDGNRSNINLIHMYCGRFTLYAGKKIELDKYNDYRFIIGCGPFFSYDLSDLRMTDESSYGWDGEKKGSEMHTKSSIYATEAINFRKSDIGPSLMVGLELKRIQITVNMYWGCLNTLYNERNTAKNRMYTLSFGCFLPTN